MTGRLQRGTRQYVFGYGSLLHPDSLRRTLPEVDLRACIPARAAGLVRCFDVAFPNDGSQQDKAYYDTDGARPPRVLLANLRPAGDAKANGICIPVGEAGLAALRARELRYAPKPIAVEPYLGWPAPGGQVLAFLGLHEFTQPDDVARGLLSAAYRDVVVTGAQRWDQQVPGFAADFRASTRLPGADRVRALHRQDLPAARNR